MKYSKILKIFTRGTAYLLALSLMLGQSMVSIAAEEKPQVVETPGSQEKNTSGNEIKYITDIIELAGEDSYLVYEEKPTLEELQNVLPETLTVLIKDETDTAEIEVNWECETDYEADKEDETKVIYTFLPEWDESAYMLEKETAEMIQIPEIKIEILEEEVLPQVENLEAAQEDLQEITDEKSILALVYLSDKYNVKDSPSPDGNTVVTVTSGQTVEIEDVDLDEKGNVWYKVSLYRNEKTYTGYIEKLYLATSDESFLEWTDKHIDEIVDKNLAGRPKTLSLAPLSSYPDVDQFPASYQNALLALKRSYPNWIFVKMDTGLNFNTAVSNELGNKSWISSSKPASWKNGAAEQSGWSYASEGILRYYMDPRNFLTDSTIFQFEQLTYNASYHTENAVQAIVSSSFMSGDIPGENMTYARAFRKIGEELKISPFHLASRVLQEQGTKGTSHLISGTYSGYEGYYNYFNVGANGKDDVLIINGLTEARNRGWNTRYKSLYGGAKVIGDSYILKGQDTLYLQKFNVSSNNTYNHQYMQNIQAPASEAPSIKKAYSNTGSLNNSFVFKIPVYSNMPASACPQPDTTDKITLDKQTVNNLAVDKTEKLTPYVNGSKLDNLSGMTFTSNNTGVATVDTQGIIKGISPGTAVITCARNNATSASCIVTVVKAEPVVDTPVISPVVYKPGLKLSDISLPSGWNWNAPSMALEAGTTSYPAVYTPVDTTKYLTVTRQISLKVSPTFPSCDVPKNLTAVLGSRLGSIALPTGFSWESDVETILDKAGEQTFYLSYNPNDKNYLELSHVPVIVKVIDENVKPDDQDGSQTGGDSGSTGNGNTGNSSSSSSGTDNGNSGSSGTGNGNTGNSGSSGAGNGNTGNSGSSSSGTGSGNISSTGSTGNESTSSSGNIGTDGSTGNGNTSDSGNTDNDTSTGSSNIGSSDSTSSGDTDSGDTSNSSSASSGSRGNEGSTDRGNTENSGSAGNTGNNSSSAGGNSGENKTTGSGTVNNDNTDNSSAEQKGSNNINSENTVNSQITNNEIANNETFNSDETINNETVNNSETINNGTGTNGNTVNNNSSVQSSNTNKTVTETDGNGLSEDSDAMAEDDSKEPMYERPAVTMDMEDIPILTAEMLQMAKDQDIDLTLRMNERASWHINVSAMEENFSDFDMSILFENGVIPEDLLADLIDGNEYLEFNLAHEGSFEFGAELEVALGSENSGRFANLFYYNLEKDTLEFICAVIIDENGYAKFPMEHASSYVIVVSDYSMADLLAEDEASAFLLRRILLGTFILMALLVIGCFGYFYLHRRKEDESNDEYDEEDDIQEMDVDAEEINGIDMEEIDIDAEEINGIDMGEIDIDAEEINGIDMEEIDLDTEEINDIDMEDVVIEDRMIEDIVEENMEDVDIIEDEDILDEETIGETEEIEKIETAADGAEKENSVYRDAMKEREKLPADIDMESGNDEDDWIEDQDWQEPEKSEVQDPFADDHAENDWIEDDEWDIGNDWMDDDEWESKNLKYGSVN